MSDLVTFLLERIAEDEAVARAAIDPDRPGTHWQWFYNDDDTPVSLPKDEEDDRFRASLRTVEEFPTASGVGDLPAFPLGYVEMEETYALPHIARHDPARVLVECETKRRIVALHQPDHLEPDVCAVCASHGDLWPCRTLRALASVYSGHPEFRAEEWA